MLNKDKANGGRVLLAQNKSQEGFYGTSGHYKGSQLLFTSKKKNVRVTSKAAGCLGKCLCPILYLPQNKQVWNVLAS